MIIMSRPGLACSLQLIGANVGQVHVGQPPGHPRIQEAWAPHHYKALLTLPNLTPPFTSKLVNDILRWSTAANKSKEPDH